MEQLECDVLIIGGGPVGVTQALLLANQGVSVIVAEKEADIYPLPRAASFDHEIMRICQGLGLADEIMPYLAGGDAYNFLTADGDVLMHFDVPETSPSGWPAARGIHQPSIERILRRSLNEKPNAELYVQWVFEGLETDKDGVTATLSTPEGIRTVRAKYIVGCDGARSPVRESAGIEFKDLSFSEPWLVIDVLVKDRSRLPDTFLQICDPARPTTSVIMGHGRHRWEFMMLPGETAEQVTQPEFIEQLLEPWNVKGAVEHERTAVYTFRALIAKEWRKGRLMLAGDAAHQMPPFAGQGLCSGLRDAVNLAWKLGAIIKDGVSEDILETYQSEREPNVRAIIDMAILMGRTVCITDPAAAKQRDEKMLAERAAGQSVDEGGTVTYPPILEGIIAKGTPGAGTLFPQPWAAGLRLDDVLGPGAHLLVGEEAEVKSGATVWSLNDPSLAPFKQDIRRWLDQQDGAEAVLIRPDHYVFGTGKAEDLAHAYANSLANPAYQDLSMESV